jgi:hypothetical protein
LAAAQKKDKELLYLSSYRYKLMSIRESLKERGRAFMGGTVEHYWVKNRRKKTVQSANINSDVELVCTRYKTGAKFLPFFIISTSFFL